jgi:hypothetical protein
MGGERVNGEGEGWWIWWMIYFVFIYENRTMKPVKIFPRRKQEDKGEW